VRFGSDVALEDFDPPRVAILARELRVELEVPFTSRHQLVNLTAAVAAAQAVGVEPSGRVEVSFGAMRGERIELPSGAVIINDCYNANPLSMRAALDDLATQAPDGGRRLAVLGDMLELGAGEVAEHRALGEYAASSGVDVLVAVGPLSAHMLETFEGEAHHVDDAAAAASLVSELVRPGDVVLVKASRGIGLETVAEALARG
jgi:UDP-N-acetylmuramoyl-tripeptide--D-alanyl-D-alanine ligase